ncbi:MAG TPA: hypothetical protein VHO25_22005 [Polyangiaceae bacterium]|nr:hypothetical protein [Polyangiaceae bacterium]
MTPLVYTKPNRLRAVATVAKFLVTAPLLTIGLGMVAWNVITGHR